MATKKAKARKSARKPAKAATAKRPAAKRAPKDEVPASTDPVRRAATGVYAQLQALAGEINTEALNMERADEHREHLLQLQLRVQDILKTARRALSPAQIFEQPVGER